MSATSPQFIIIAGPNGAGKSTSATTLLPHGMPYINADEIAKRLREAAPASDIEAGRQLIREWEEYESRLDDFAIETTLASRSLGPRIARLQTKGYRFRLIYFWLPDVELAIERVAERVRQGGHDIPHETIRRRYRSGIRNFFDLYMPIADRWSVYWNIAGGAPELIARGGSEMQDEIAIPEVWGNVHASNH